MRCPPIPIYDAYVVPDIGATPRRWHFCTKVSVAVIALWLGHESVETTQIYLHADLQVKEKAMQRTKPVDTPPGRYRPSDALLDYLGKGFDYADIPKHRESVGSKGWDTNAA